MVWRNGGRLRAVPSSAVIIASAVLTPVVQTRRPAGGRFHASRGSEFTCDRQVSRKRPWTDRDSACPGFAVFSADRLDAFLSVKEPIIAFGRFCGPERTTASQAEIVAAHLGL